MQEPVKFFNFQLPYRTFKKLRDISQRNDCSVAEVVRQAINLLLDKLNNSSEQKASGK